jgi:AmmeMemoRadiSam system protein A
VVRNTIAATRDPRFEAVSADELAGMHIEISLLGPFNEVRYVNCRDLLEHLRPGIDGVIVTWQEHRGLLLPQVWDRFPQPQQFMQALCHKANIPWNSLDLSPPQVDVVTFEVVCFVDPDEGTDDVKGTAIGRGQA